MHTVLTAESLWTGSTLLPYPIVEIEGDRVVAITEGFGAQVDVPGAEVHEFKDAMLAPAFFDVHIHGAAGHDVMEATPQALGAIGKFLATRGTGSYLATTVTAPLDMTLRALDGLAKLIDHPEQIDPDGDAALPIGIHLEGPFLSHAKCGVQPREFLLEPDIPTFDRLYEAAGGHARLITLAPELPGAVELAAHATAKGVRVSVGHSNATAAETRAAIAAGAVSATHTFNAMRPLDHREPGILGTVLATDSLYSELICDGIHTAPEMAKIWWKTKGPERGILVTDAMSAAGMPDGEYQLGSFAVQVANGRATARGALAGSVLTLDRALENFVRFTGATVEEALRLLTVNPAAMTGFGDAAGTIAVGRKANIVAIDDHGRLVASIHNGRLMGAVAAR
jgi:N-acetylglucosamine-6-phosphate deacetylase